MKVFPRPIVVVSKCIEYEPERWDSSLIANDLFKMLKDYVEFIPTCPEVEIGLGVPLERVRIVKKNNTLRLVQSTTNQNLTEKIEYYADSFLSGLGDVDGFILTSKSPTSAIKDSKIYPSEGRVAALGYGPGFFGKFVLEKSLNMAVEDELCLLNERIRKHFLIKIFNHADFREVKKSKSDSKLVDFQARNKLLFTAYNQTELHLMGHLVGEEKRCSLKN